LQWSIAERPTVADARADLPLTRRKELAVMASMKKRLAIVTAIVWTCAFGSAAALGYVLDRPLHPRGTPEHVAAPAPPPPSGDVFVVPPAEPAPALIIPTITIVGPAPRPAVKKVAPPEHPDISEMSCTQWRPLEMGSGSVQVCE
jgi:hypothetical protein